MIKGKIYNVNVIDLPNKKYIWILDNMQNAFEFADEDKEYNVDMIIKEPFGCSYYVSKLSLKRLCKIIGGNPLKAWKQ